MSFVWKKLKISFLAVSVHQQFSNTLFRMYQENRTSQTYNYKNYQPCEVLHRASVCWWTANFQWLVHDSYFPKCCLLHWTWFLSIYLFIYFFRNPDRHHLSQLITDWPHLEQIVRLSYVKVHPSSLHLTSPYFFFFAPPCYSLQL